MDLVELRRRLKVVVGGASTSPEDDEELCRAWITAMGLEGAVNSDTAWSVDVGGSAAAMLAVLDRQAPQPPAVVWPASEGLSAEPAYDLALALMLSPAVRWVIVDDVQPDRHRHISHLISEAVGGVGLSFSEIQVARHQYEALRRQDATHQEIARLERELAELKARIGVA